MSVWFCDADGRGLWNPATRVGETFLVTLSGLESVVGVRSGVGDVRNDEVIVDGFALWRLVLAVVEQSSHPVMRSQVSGVVAVALVLLDRLEIEIGDAGVPSDLVAAADELSGKMPW